MNDYIIKIDGTQNQEGEENTVSLSTRGKFALQNGKYYISYDETEATGFEGSTTTVKVNGNDCVSMIRHGEAPSHLVIQPGKRHLCHYQTGEGPLMLGISAHQIKNELTKRGGTLSFSYTLDINSIDLSTNYINISVKEV